MKFSMSILEDLNCCLLTMQVPNAFSMKFGNTLEEVKSKKWIPYHHVYKWQLDENKKFRKVYGYFLLKNGEIAILIANEIQQ